MNSKYYHEVLKKKGDKSKHKVLQLKATGVLKFVKKVFFDDFKEKFVKKVFFKDFKENFKKNPVILVVSSSNWFKSCRRSKPTV